MTTPFAPIHDKERTRIDHLMGMLDPEPLGLVLEIGARDGRVTQFLLERARKVVALDLTAPTLRHDQVAPIAANLERLPFPDRSFDTVLCTEVLEHIPEPGLQRATAELARVVRGRLLVGVPFDQDIRLGASRCTRCGTVNPPWGHVNRFTRERLLAAFPTLRVDEVAFCGQTRRSQPEISAWIEARLGHPNGMTSQEEPCIACGAELTPPELSPMRRAAALVPRALNKAARTLATPRPSWIHVQFSPPDLQAAPSHSP